MTLLEQTYRRLRDFGLVETGESFSTRYLGRNKNWYAWQRHAGRDLSAGAAVNCLRAVRAQLATTRLATEQERALTQTAAQLLEHLQAHHFVADVCA